MTTTERNRQAAGQPTGGQFAPTSGSDAGLDLGAERPLSHSAEFKYEDVLLGRTSDGSRVWVSIKATPGDPEQFVRMTNHTTAREPARLSFTGAVADKGQSMANASSVGQVQDALDDVIDLAPGVTREDIDQIKADWNQYHLNDLNAACDCMDPDSVPPREEWPKTSYGAPDHYEAHRQHFATACDQGYQYGSRWLKREVPSEVFERMSEIGSRLSP